MFPVAFVMGVTEDVQETLHVARLIGTKTAVNEFVAYKKLGELILSESQELSVSCLFCSHYSYTIFQALESASLTWLVPRHLNDVAESSDQISLEDLHRVTTALLAGTSWNIPTVLSPSTSAVVLVIQELGAVLRLLLRWREQWAIVYCPFSYSSSSRWKIACIKQFLPLFFLVECDFLVLARYQKKVKKGIDCIDNIK